MKNYYAILVMLIFNLQLHAQNPQSFQICGPVKVNRYYIYNINNFYTAPREYGEKFLFRKKDVLKGRQYFKRYGRFHLFFRNRFSINLWKINPQGLKIIPAANPNGGIDTFIHTGIVLKYPIEVNGVLNYISSDEHTPTITDSFRFVQKCKHYDKKHFEFYTKK